MLYGRYWLVICFKYNVYVLIPNSLTKRLVLWIRIGRIWQPTRVLLPGESHGQRSCSPPGTSVHGITKTQTWLSKWAHIHAQYEVWRHSHETEMTLNRETVTFRGAGGSYWSNTRLFSLQKQHASSQAFNPLFPFSQKLLFKCKWKPAPSPPKKET